MSKLPKIKVIWEPTPWANYVRYNDFLTPSELINKYVCSCGDCETYSPFAVLEHLKQSHGISELICIEIFGDHDEDWTQIDAASAHIKKNDPTPKEFRGRRVLTEEEWQKEMEDAERETRKKEVDQN